MICKNVSSSFIKFDMDGSDEELLVNEQDLYSLLNATSSSFINITKNKGKIELTDGKDRFLLQSPPVTDFNMPTIPDSETTTVSGAFLNAVSSASAFTQFIKDMPTYYGFIHIGEGSVCAGDGIIIYHCPVEENIKLVLEGSIAKFLSKLDIQSIGIADNYYYFLTNDCTIGIAKPSEGWFDIRKVFKNKREYSFTGSSSDIVSFNTLSLQLSKTALVTLSNGKFEMTDMLFDKYHERIAENIKIESPFSYNPDRMNTVINGLDCEEIEFHDAAGCYFLSSKDTKATTIIAKINK